MPRALDGIEVPVTSARWSHIGHCRRSFRDLWMAGQVIGRAIFPPPDWSVRMTKQLRCGDVMPGCTFVTRAETEDELMQAVASHAAGTHGVTDITPELIAKVRSAVRDVPA